MVIQLLLRSINDSRSAYAAFRIDQSFFEEYNQTSEDIASVKVQAKVSLQVHLWLISQILADTLAIELYICFQKLKQHWDLHNSNRPRIVRCGVWLALPSWGEKELQVVLWRAEANPGYLRQSLSQQGRGTAKNAAGLNSKLPFEPWGNYDDCQSRQPDLEELHWRDK